MSEHEPATPSRPARRGGGKFLPLIVVLVGVAVLVFALATQVSAPVPPASAAGTIDPRPTASASRSSVPGPVVSPKRGRAGSRPTAPAVIKPVPPSAPVSISIPAIKVKSAVFPIGKTADGTLKAPPPGPDRNKVAWFKNSVTPGQLGPSVLEGHVDTEQGPSVFLDLGDVRPGDTVTITRRDGRKAKYTVDAVRNYSKAKFPTQLVYGADLDQATLRLITCSDFDPRIRHHVGNLVVFGHLTSV